MLPNNHDAITAQVLHAEERLRIAMLDADVASLNELLASRLLFTNHLGQLLGKEDDLAAYRSGLLRVLHLACSEQRVEVTGDTAVVSMRAQLTGTYAGQPANGDFRFTRVWVLSGGKLEVIAAHAGLISTISPLTS